MLQNEQGGKIVAKLKRYHHYVNKNKTSRWIAEIIPTEDIEVSEKMLKEYEDKSEKKVAQ